MQGIRSLRYSSVPWHPRESRSPCKNAVNDSTIAKPISWWQGWHLFHCISPMSLQDGKKIFTDKQQLATGFACSSRTVSPDEHCYRLICASCTQFHVPPGTQAFQLPQAASKQRSVPWCCRCGMFAASTTAAIRLLRSIFIWAPPRTRPKFQHLCEHRKIFQPVSRMLILEIHNAVVAVPADVTSLGCHCPPNIFMLLTVFWYISYDDDESVVLSRSWPLPSQQRLAEMSSYRLTRLDRRVLGWHHSKYRWWCLPPSNDTFSSKQPANQLLPDSVRFLVAKNILEPIQSSQAQMKECVVEFVHQRHPPLDGFPAHSLPWQNTLKSPNTLCDMFVH